MENSPGGRLGEKCLLFIRQMETDATESQGKFVGPGREGGSVCVLWGVFTALFSPLPTTLLFFFPHQQQSGR